MILTDLGVILSIIGATGVLFDQFKRQTSFSCLSLDALLQVLLWSHSFFLELHT